MTETTLPTPERSTHRILILWGVVASFAAVLFAGAAVYFFLRAQRDSTEQTNPGINHNTSGGRAEAGHGPVEDVPGRYRLIEANRDLGVMTLYPDLSFANEKGERRRNYRWELQSDALVIHWLRAVAQLTNVAGQRAFEG